MTLMNFPTSITINAVRLKNNIYQLVAFKQQTIFATLLCQAGYCYFCFKLINQGLLQLCRSLALYFGWIMGGLRKWGDENNEIFL